MTRYSYLAKDSEGKAYKGSIEAKSEKELHDKLKTMGFYATSIKREREIFTVSTTVKQADLVIFARQLSTMISAGLPLITSLKALEKQTESVPLKIVINDVRLSIEGGISLSEAIGKHPSVFSEFFIAMIKAGETGGALDKILDGLANHLEKQDSLRRNVRSAFAYPSIVGVLAILVVGFLVVVIVPVFKDVYAKMHLNLPGPTLALIAISNFVRGFWWLMLMFAIGLTVLLKWVNRNPAFKEGLDRFKINMPIFGRLLRKATAARFVRTFGDMISHGVAILVCIRIADKVAANRIVSKIANAMTDAINRGGRVSDSLREQNIFPAGVVQMIASGEESGKLDFMLQKAADGLDRDVDDTVKRLVVKIEPLMTLLMALLVGFIAISIYMPIFNIIEEMSIR